MKREFAGSNCVYCGERAATTADHIFARGFFHPDDRDNDELPQVPACAECNNEKSKLENYAMTVLPVGGTHPAALKYAQDKLVGRLEQNKKLHEELKAGFRQVWVQYGPNGIVQPSASLDVDARLIGVLFAYIGRALLWYHGKAHLPSDYCVHVRFATDEDDKQFRELLDQWPQEHHTTKRLRNETVQYEGIWNPTQPGYSVWRMTIYGANFGTHDPNKGVFRTVWIFTDKHAGQMLP